jgi:hypothetical protein
MYAPQLQYWIAIEVANKVKDGIQRLIELFVNAINEPFLCHSYYAITATKHIPDMLLWIIVNTIIHHVIPWTIALAALQIVSQLLLWENTPANKCNRMNTPANKY